MVIFVLGASILKNTRGTDLRIHILYEYISPWDQSDQSHQGAFYVQGWRGDSKICFLMLALGHSLVYSAPILNLRRVTYVTNSR